MLNPRKIEISLLDGNPNGIRFAQLDIFAIRVFAFRRNQLRIVCNEFPEMEQPGVYILIGIEDSDEERPIAYIGESECLKDRLYYHNSTEKEETKFWEDTIVVLSTNQNITGSHARCIESMLINDSKKNLRWSVSNKKTPSDSAGKLPNTDRAVMKNFVEQSKTLVSVLGWDLFRPFIGRSSEPEMNKTESSTELVAHDPTFQLDGEGYSAKMKINQSGEFVVQNGSKVRHKPKKSFPGKTSKLRKSLLDKGVLCEDADQTRFITDFSFTSVSSAASMVMGINANGRASWKLLDDRTYAEWEADLTKSD